MAAAPTHSRFGWYFGKLRAFSKLKRNAIPTMQWRFVYPVGERVCGSATRGALIN